MKLCSHLIMLVVVTLVPILIFSLLLVVRLHRQEQAAIERGLRSGGIRVRRAAAAITSRRSAV